MAGEADGRQVRHASFDNHTLDSMDMLLRMASEDDAPIESLTELLKRTEYIEETLRQHATLRS